MQVFRLLTLTAVALLSLAALPSAADDPSSAFEVRQGQRPPLGYARPPFHIKRNSITGPVGLLPQQIRHFYGFDQIPNQGAGQVIGIVDAYDDPNIASDLAYFTTTLGLPSCDFQKIYAAGKKPKTNAGWALEMALDVEWACAIAPQAKILLVEAASSSFSNLLAAVDVAIKMGASVVSMSWGGSEFAQEKSYDSHFSSPAGVIFTASSGDSGIGVEYPAASSYVVGVGGTTISTDPNGDYNGEGAWSGSGGGQSTYESEPYYQTGFQIPNDSGNKRGVPDVAYDGDPNTGVAVYNSVKYLGQSGWFQVGGTSVGAPQWAALFAIVNSLRAASNKPMLSTSPFSESGSPSYNAAAGSAYAVNYHDIIFGSNGTCGSLCTAATGYDYVTGLGSLQANNIIPALANQ